MPNENAYRLGAARSCIRELFEYGNQRAAVVGRENVFDFSLGNPSIPTPQAVTDALSRLIGQDDPLSLHGYTSAAGDPAVRQSIADDLNRRFGADITAGELFITCGAAPALSAALKAIGRAGQTVLTVAPYFPEYRVFVENADMRFQSVAALPPDFDLPVAAIADALTPDTAIVLLNSPNNPSGAVYSEAAVKQLADMLVQKSRCYGHSIYLLSDEPYRELTYDGICTPFIPTIYRDSVVCYSYSKSLSLPGERIGYVYVPRRAADGEALFLAVAGAARSMGHVCAPSLWQRVIGMCTALRPDLRAYDRNRQTLYRGLTALGYECATPRGAFYLFVKAPGGDAVAFSELARQYDVLLVPGDGFGYPGWFRLSYCVSCDTIVRSLPLFEKMAKSIPGTGVQTISETR